MRRTSISIREYLSRLRSGIETRELFQESAFDRHRRQHLSNSVLETWKISVEHSGRRTKWRTTSFTA
jgi:hypothetical protein